MALAAQCTIAKASGGSPITFHGAHGNLLMPTVQGDRFRRAVSTRAGYQRLGIDVRESVLEFWQACADAAAAKVFIDSLNGLCYEVVTVTWKEYTAERCVFKSWDLSLSRACKGPIITGTTVARWRVEGSCILEVAQS